VGIAEDYNLEADLRAGAKVKSVQLVNNSQAEWLPVGAIIPDPNDTVSTVAHPTPVLDRLRAAIANPEISEQDREAARQVLRISFHTKD
jgi:hypothetical protein